MDQREPLEANADSSVEPDLYLNDGQREAIANLTRGFAGSVGLAILKDGYFKLIFYAPEGDVIATELIWVRYGDAAMPDGPPAAVTEWTAKH